MLLHSYRFASPENRSYRLGIVNSLLLLFALISLLPKNTFQSLLLHRYWKNFLPFCILENFFFCRINLAGPKFRIYFQKSMKIKQENWIWRNWGVKFSIPCFQSKGSNRRLTRYIPTISIRSSSLSLSPTPRNSTVTPSVPPAFFCSYPYSLRHLVLYVVSLRIQKEQETWATTRHRVRKAQRIASSAFSSQNSNLKLNLNSNFCWKSRRLTFP